MLDFLSQLFLVAGTQWVLWFMFGLAVRFAYINIFGGDQQ